MMKKVGLHVRSHAAPVNSSSDESDIQSSVKGDPLTKIVKKCQKQR